MSSKTIRISVEFWEDLQGVADQLDTSIKSVIDMIIEWFFKTDWGNPDVIARLMADYQDDEDDDEEEDDEDLEDLEDDEDDDDE